MGISNTMSYRQGLWFLLLSLFVYLVALGLICSGLSCGNWMALKLPVLRLAFLILPLHYAHILPEPHSLCPEAYFSNSGGSSELPTGRETEVSGMLSQQDRNKEDAGVILNGGRVMSQEEENLSLSRTQEFVRMLSVLCSGRGLPSVLCEE